MLFLLLHFRFPRCHYFFCSIAIKVCSFIASSFINNISLFITFILICYSFLSSFVSFSCLIKFFQSFVFANLFSFIHLTYRSLSRFTLTYSAVSPFSISQSCYFVFALFHSFFKCRRSHREIRTNMHGKVMLMNHPFAGRCCTGPYFIRTDRNH